MTWCKPQQQNQREMLQQGSVLKKKSTDMLRSITWTLTYEWRSGKGHFDWCITFVDEVHVLDWERERERERERDEREKRREKERGEREREREREREKRREREREREKRERERERERERGERKWKTMMEKADRNRQIYDSNHAWKNNY